MNGPRKKEHQVLKHTIDVPDKELDSNRLNVLDEKDDSVKLVKGSYGLFGNLGPDGRPEDGIDYFGRVVLDSLVVIEHHVHTILYKLLESHFALLNIIFVL